MKFGKNKEKNDYNKNDRKKDNKMSIREINKKYLKNGSYSMAITAVFIIIIIVINLIVNELPSSVTEIDLSDEKLYSIGDTTKEFLKDLDKDVTIYQIAPEGNQDEVISNLLEKYEDESKHVKVELKDPIVNPKFVTDYTSDNISSNSLIVVCGDRNKVVDYNSMYESTINYNTYSYDTTGFDGEGQITSAIAYVTSENLPILYTLEGHGEIDLNSSVREDIEKANIDIQSLNLLTEGSVPEDADCLMIISPSSDITEDEKNAVLEYLENGGKAMIFSDYTGKEMTNFDSILENYGVKREEGIVFEGDTQHYAAQMPYYLVPDVKNSEATSDVVSAGYYILAPYAQGITTLDNIRDTLTVTSLLSTSDSAYSKTNVQSGSIEKEDGDIDGPFDLGVSISESVGENETKLVYFSTANLMDSQVNQMVSGGNEQLIMSALNWMCSSEEALTISIPSKSLEVSYLTLTAYDSSFWMICTIGLIPGFFLVAGFVIWFMRRKA